jgi:hypothetical protein
MSSGPLAGDSWTVLLNGLRNVRTAWPARGWSWDTRFNCVTSSFNVEVEAKAKAAVVAVLNSEWTSATIQSAAPAIRGLADRTGGLRSGQLILATPAVGNSFAYGLWWPWGDAITTSLRIGLGGSGIREETLRRLREVFNVEP